MREEQPNPCSGWVLCKGVRGVGGCTHAKVHPRAVSRASCSSAPAQRVPSLLGYTFPAALGSCCQEPPPKLCFPPTQLTYLGSGQTDGVPMSVPMEMGPAALCALLGV